ncbi:MAG TPA: DUF4349 domain-containing protein [Gaiellaceae bacterium]|nr:DUF4349 domain-containing protein [Gaiellaceae bacterium]
MSAPDRSELDGNEALVSELRATPPVAPERLRQRVLALEPGARVRMSKRRRLTLVVVPVAVVLAIGAAVIHGFVSSGSNQKRAMEPSLAFHHLTTAHGSSATGTARSRARLNVSGKSGNQLRQAAAQAAGQPPAEKTYNGPFYAAAGPKVTLNGLEQAVTIPTNRLVHADASLQVSVKGHAALTKATNNATQIVSSLGGYAQSVSYQSSHGGEGDALLQLRVPVQKAEIAIGRLANLGTLLSQQVSTKDLQQRLTSQTNGIGSLKRAIAVYEQALNGGTLSGSERVQIQIKLSNARHAITQLRRDRTATLQSGATSNISLLLTTRQHAFGVTHHGSTRIGRLLGSAAHFLALEGIIVLYALIVVAPLLVLGGLAWWVVRERRRREERLLASA